MQARPSQDDVGRIADVRSPWCATIYGDLASWARGNHETDAATTQISAVMSRLQAVGAPSATADAIREQLRQVSAPASRPGSIDGRAHSIAIFATEEGADVFALATSPAPWVGVADRFLVGPLLAGALSMVDPAFVLATSENEVRLVDVTAHPPQLVEVPSLPRDLETTIALDLTGDRDTLAHLRTSEDPKGRLREYARAIDRAVHPILRREGALLVIAAAEPLASIVRATMSHDSVASAAIPGNRDRSSVEELAVLAGPIIERHQRESLDARLARFTEMPARDLVLAELAAVADAARNGAVDTLFVDVDSRIPVPGQAFDGPTTIDRVDEIIRDALSHGATIVPVRPDDLPTPDPVAAVLRYPQPGRTAPAA